MRPHTRACAVRNGKDLDEYQYDRKVAESDSEPPFKMSRPEASIDAKADIKKRTCELALENRAVGPEKIWEKVKTEMGLDHSEKHFSGFQPLEITLKKVFMFSFTAHHGQPCHSEFQSTLFQSKKMEP